MPPRRARVRSRVAGNACGFPGRPRSPRESTRPRTIPPRASKRSLPVTDLLTRIISLTEPAVSAAAVASTPVMLREESAGIVREPRGERPRAAAHSTWRQASRSDIAESGVSSRRGRETCYCAAGRSSRESNRAAYSRSARALCPTRPFASASKSASKSRVVTRSMSGPTRSRAARWLNAPRSPCIATRVRPLASHVSPRCTRYR